MFQIAGFCNLKQLKEVKMLFDSHAHLNDARFDPDRRYVAGALKKNGVGAVICAGYDLESSAFALELAHKYENIYAVCGLHPDAADDFEASDLCKLAKMLDDEKCVGLGEIGLDYYYETPSREKQKLLFEKQLELAKERNEKIVIHDRDAHEDCLRLVKKYGVTGVFHCFSGSAEMAKEVVKLGFYVSFSGVLTFKNARKAVEAAQAVPLDRILIETDCPYMAPVPFRGKRNEPRLVGCVARKLAEIKGISEDEAERITFENTCRLYGLEGIKNA